VKRAIISDVHGNLEALQAVLSDIDRQGIQDIICLGDIVGYGPNPCECVDLLGRCKLGVLGNHDQGALFDPEGFSSTAEKAIFWTRDQLESQGSEEQRAARCNYLAELPRVARLDGLLFVHGSPRNPLSEYVFPDDIYNPKKLEKLFALVERACFQGHTHVPGIFTSAGRFQSPSDAGMHYVLGAEKAMINVGSVGQPRDSDPRACYVVLDDDVVSYRRVEYAVDITAAKIYAIPELDNHLGDRLKEGR